MMMMMMIVVSSDCFHRKTIWYENRFFSLLPRFPLISIHILFPHRCRRRLLLLNLSINRVQHSNRNMSLNSFSLSLWFFRCHFCCCCAIVSLSCLRCIPPNAVTHDVLDRFEFRVWTFIVHQQTVSSIFLIFCCCCCLPLTTRFVLSFRRSFFSLGGTPIATCADASAQLKYPFYSDLLFEKRTRPIQIVVAFHVPIVEIVDGNGNKNVGLFCRSLSLSPPTSHSLSFGCLYVSFSQSCLCMLICQSGWEAKE